MVTTQTIAFPVNLSFSLLSVYASNFLFFFISDNHSLVLDTSVCVSLLSVCPSVQWFLHHLFRTSESVLGSPAFYGNSGVLACGSSQLCIGCFAQVNIFEILIIKHLLSVVSLVETSFLTTFYGLYFIINFLHSYTVDKGALSWNVKPLLGHFGGRVA